MAKRSLCCPHTGSYQPIIGALLSLSLASGVVLGQDQGGSSPVFQESIAVHEVRLEVRIENGLGLPVDDLTQSDFTVTEDGEPVEIVRFQVLNPRGVATPTASARVETTEQQTPTPQPVVANPRQQETVVLLFDFVDNRIRFVNAVDEISRWVDQNSRLVAERTWIVATLDGAVGLLDSPTQDPETLKTTLEELKKKRSEETRVWRFVASPSESAWVQKAREFNAASHPSQTNAGPTTATGEDEQLKRFRGSDCRMQAEWMVGQTSKLRQLVESLSPLPGRKTVVWVHGTSFSSVPQGCPAKDVFQATRASWELGSLAAAAGVVLHASDMSGLTLRYGSADSSASDMGLIGEYMETAAVASGYEHFLSLGSLARNMSIHTGGHRVVLNDPSYVFHRAFEEPVYEVTVLVPHGRDGLHHRIKVKVEGHPLARLSYQRNYVDLDKRSLLLNQVERMSLLPGSYGSFPVHLSGSGLQDGKNIETRVTIATPAHKIGMMVDGDHLVAKLEPFIAVYQVNGQLIELRELEASEVRVDNARGIRPSDAFKVSTTFELSPGEYLFTGAFFDTLNETSGVTSARLDLNQFVSE